MGRTNLADLPAGDDADEEETLYSAAYEQVVYRDSTDDGIEGDVLGDDAVRRDRGPQGEGGAPGRAATVPREPGAIVAADGHSACRPRRLDRGPAAVRSATGGSLLRTVVTSSAGCSRAPTTFRFPPPTGSHQSLLDYDRRRMTKEGLLDRILSTCVAMARRRTVPCRRGRRARRVRHAQCRSPCSAVCSRAIQPGCEPVGRSCSRRCGIAPCSTSPGQGRPPA